MYSFLHGTCQSSQNTCHSCASEQVVDIVQKIFSRGGGREAADACAEVISVSAERWRQFEGAYRDDISCIVLRLPCFHPAVGFTARSENYNERTSESAPCK